MNHRRRSRAGSAWLELLLAIAAFMLALQFSPTLRSWLVAVVDVRQWSRTSWFVANIAGVVALAAIRFGPDAAPAVRRLARKLLSLKRPSTGYVVTTEEYEERRKRDAEWRERAKKRHPFS